MGGSDFRVTKDDLKTYLASWQFIIRMLTIVLALVYDFTYHTEGTSFYAAFEVY